MSDKDKKPNYITRNRWVLDLLNAIDTKHDLTLALCFCVITLIGAVMMKLGYITIFIAVISETFSDSIHAYILENIRKTPNYNKIENDNVMTFTFIAMFIIHFALAVSVIILERLLA